MSTVNRRGLIASDCPSVTTEKQFFPVPSNTEIDGVLRVCNKSTLNAIYSVAHCEALHGNTAADDKDWLYYNKAINPNTTIEISIHAGPQESIRVRSGTASGVTFHLSGNTKVTS